MQTTIVGILTIACLLLVRACQVLYRTLKREREWADHPASFTNLVEIKRPILPWSRDRTMACVLGLCQ
jgi:hypothetical protein